MKLTSEQIYEMKKAALPLIEWLAKNVHPMCEARVDGDSVELMEKVAKTNKDWKGPK